MAAIPAVSRISSRIIRILGCNPGPMTLQGTNTYLLGTGRRRILLDAGDEDVPEYIANLQNVLKEENVTLEHILVSHWHHDHIGGLKNIFDGNIKDVGSTKIWKYPCMGKETFPTYNLKIEELRDNQEFSVEGANIKILYTPGHTSDHVILYLQEEQAIFSADCILGEGTGVFEDLYDYMNSLKLILGYKPKIIYPGHGNIIYNTNEKIQYYIDHRIQREKQILEVLSQNLKRSYSEMDLVKCIYKDTPEHLHLAAAHNVNHHLTKLLKEKRVIENDGLWQFIISNKI